MIQCVPSGNDAKVRGLMWVMWRNLAQDLNFNGCPLPFGAGACQSSRRARSTSQAPTFRKLCFNICWQRCHWHPKRLAWSTSPHMIAGLKRLAWSTLTAIICFLNWYSLMNWPLKSANSFIECNPEASSLQTVSVQGLTKWCLVTKHARSASARTAPSLTSVRRL